LQNIGTKYLLPVVLKILMDNPLAEGDLYEGDLLEATLKIDNSVWQRKQEYASQYRELIKNYESIIADELGEKTLKRLIEKIN
jgi:hypothetical protein